MILHEVTSNDAPLQAIGTSLTDNEMSAEIDLQLRFMERFRHEEILCPM
jgi:hypothetical protein